MIFDKFGNKALEAGQRGIQRAQKNQQELTLNSKPEEIVIALGKASLALLKGTYRLFADTEQAIQDAKVAIEKATDAIDAATKALSEKLKTVPEKLKAMTVYDAIEDGVALGLGWFTTGCPASFCAAVTRVSNVFETVKKGGKKIKRGMVKVAQKRKVAKRLGKGVRTGVGKKAKAVARSLGQKAKVWTKLKAEELKKIGKRSLQRDIREIKGNSKDAFDFFKAQVESFEKKPNGTFVGKDKNGITFAYRATSASGPPTIDINKIKGVRKIKFLDN